MTDVADETAYYFNKGILAVAMIAQGVRFPLGKWIRVANVSAHPHQVERMLANVYPDLKGKVLSFATLTTESEVAEFEGLFKPVA
jgi:hypothetical protein